MKCNSNCNVKDMFPTNAKYFKEEIISEIFTISNQKPPIERVLNIVALPEIIHLKIIDTPVGYSNEGQRLSGIKLIAEVGIREKVTYVANEPTQPVHAVQYDFMKSVFIILPASINGTATSDLLSSNRINVTPYIEALEYRALDCRNIYESIMLFVNATVC